MSDNLKAKGIIAFFWDFTGTLANQGMGFIISIFLARLLEPEEFGLIAMVLVVTGIAAIFSDGGLSAALMQKKKLLPIHYSSVFYFNIILAVTLTIITYLSADKIATFFDNNELIALMQVISFTFIISALGNIQNVRLRKELNFALSTKITLISSFVSGIVGISLAFYGASVWSLVAQNLTAGVVSSILLWVISDWRPSLMFSVKALVQLWSFGLYFFMTNLLDAIVSRLDIIIIGKLFTVDTLGYFNRAKSLNQMIISNSSGSLMAVLFPVLSKIQNDLQRLQNVIIKSFAIVTFIIFFLSGIFYLSAENIIVIIFSEKWLPSVLYFKILVLSGFAYAYGSILLSVMLGRGKSKLFFKIDIYKKIFYGLNLYFGFHYGIEGYLYGFLIASIIAHLINLYYSCKELELSPYLFMKLTLSQLFIACVSVMGTQLLIQEMHYNVFIMLLAKSASFSILYIMISWISKTESFEFFRKEFNQIVFKTINKSKV